jgi:predicted transcriptional regulator
MLMNVLLSIRPVHVANILAGTKTFEFRRKLFARKDIRSVLIYCTKPVGRFVGEFDIDGILCDSPDRLWKRTRAGSGISKQYFDDYFGGRKQAYALRIGRVRAFSRHVVPDEVIDGFSPPQSFMYVEKDLQAAWS